MELKSAESYKFTGSGYAWILATYWDGRAFTVREVQQAMVKAGFTNNNRRASDCISRMQKTSVSTLKDNYKNWVGCLKRIGKNANGEPLYTVTRQGKQLGQKISFAEEIGISLRQHNISKRIDKQLKVTVPKRGYYRTKKVFDPLSRTKALTRKKS